MKSPLLVHYDPTKCQTIIFHALSCLNNRYSVKSECPIASAFAYYIYNHQRKMSHQDDPEFPEASFKQQHFELKIFTETHQDHFFLEHMLFSLHQNLLSAADSVLMTHILFFTNTKICMQVTCCKVSIIKSLISQKYLAETWF